MNTICENQDKISVYKYLENPFFYGNLYKSTYVLLETLLLMYIWIHCAINYLNYFGIISKSVFTILWSLLSIRSFIIFHDCGHGSFYQKFKHSQLCNWVTMHVASVMCSTPTDWNVGHRLHHNNIGKLDQTDYDWGETIFHTADEFLKLNKYKQLGWRIIRHPIPFFVLAPFLTWNIKMRLPIELRPNRKAAYRLSNKLINLSFVYIKYYFAYKYNIFYSIFWGEYIGMFIGVILFHFQHVYENGYVRIDEEWNIKDAALIGSSFLYIPTFFKFFTLGIEYHHIHHLRTHIPGYMLKYVHESAPKYMWKDIVYLKPNDMWKSLKMQVYDESRQIYTTYNDVLNYHKYK